MSWTDGVDWQQLNRDLQNIEMLRLQQEQNDLLKKSLDKPHPAATIPRAAAAAPSETSLFDRLREAERQSLDSKDPNGFINMGDWWYQNGNLQEARTSYLLATKVSYADQAPPAVLCNRIAFTCERLGNKDEARSWFEVGAKSGDDNCTNSLIFSYLIPEKKWDEIDGYVANARANDAGQTTTGVISNGAISLYMRGDVEAATKLFKVALERPDRSANHEAYWWLSKIFGDKNEVTLSEDYYKLCQQAGGYTPPAWA